ncbi:MAG TPA: hypothetical protein VF228_15975 [Iamia sp.]
MSKICDRALFATELARLVGLDPDLVVSLVVSCSTTTFPMVEAVMVPPAPTGEPVAQRFAVVPLPEPEPEETPVAITPEHEKALSYHPLTEGRGELHEEIRAAAKCFAAVVDRVCPPSRESSLAFTAIQEAAMWANAALAIHDPGAEPGRSGDDD